MKILLMIGGFFSALYNHQVGTPLLPKAPVAQVQTQATAEATIATPTAKTPVARATPAVAPTKKTAPVVLAPVVTPAVATVTPAPVPTPPATVLTPAEQYVQNVESEYENGQLGDKYSAPAPQPVVQYAPQPLPVDTTKSQIATLVQQILDIKAKYYSDLDAVQHQPALSSMIAGQEQNLLNAANEKIEKINLQIQELELNGS